MTLLSRRDQPLLRGLITLAIIVFLAFLFFAFLPDDNEDERLAQLVVLFFVGYLAAIIIFVMGFLPPFARKILIAATLLQMVWAVVFMLNREAQSFMGWFFDPNTELALGPIISSSQLLAIGALAFISGLVVKRKMLYWLFLGAGMVFLASDEYFSIHENYALWRPTYIGIGASVVLLTLLVGWFEAQQRLTFLLIVIGFGIIGFSGVGLDAFANDSPIEVGDFSFNGFRCGLYKWGIYCQDFPVFEEFLELAGSTLILIGILIYLKQNLSAPQWRWSLRGVGLVVGVWIVFTFSNLWFIPTLEARLVAEDVRVEYLDGALSLVGYEVSTQEIKPGDKVKTTLYFQVNESIDYNYFVSVHLLAKPTEETFIQDDIQLGQWKYPSSAWLPGLAVRNELTFTVPNAISTPATYWLMVRVWPGPEIPNQLRGPEASISRTSLLVLDPDTLVLTNLVARPVDPVPAPPEQRRYDFSDGFSLYGVELPQEGQPGSPMTLKFWWHGERDIQRQLVHFIHFFHENGEDYFVFDLPPFEGRFPPEDWPANIDMMDEVAVTLPSELPTGIYRVQTGMYELNSKERVPVADANGREVQDFSIYVGTIEVK